MSLLLRLFRPWRWIPHLFVLSLFETLLPLGLFLLAESFLHLPQTGLQLQLVRLIPQISAYQLWSDFGPHVWVRCNFHGMTWIPDMVVTSSMGIVPSEKWGPKRCQMNWLNATNLYQLWKQLGVSNGDWVPSGLVFVNLLSARFAPWASWLIGRSRCCQKNRRSYGHSLS